MPRPTKKAPLAPTPQPASAADELNDVSIEVPNDGDTERYDRTPSSAFLLDRLLYKGVLPRYAFPTDVATFFVFDIDKSTPYKTMFRFTPSQGLALALSQYAPGKEVWVSGKLFVSGAIYSPMRSDLFEAWQNRRLYYECSVCHYARTQLLSEGSKGERLDCPACGRQATLGEARYWLRPPGFAHPVFIAERTSSDEPAGISLAARGRNSRRTRPGGDSISVFSTLETSVRMAVSWRLHSESPDRSISVPSLRAAS